MRDVNTHVNVKTPGTVQWFGEFGSQAVADNPTELASAIADFIRDYPLATARREGRRYALDISPLGVRMHQVSVEATAPDGATLEATIPVGRPVGRRAALTTLGWTVERLSSGTRYYTRRFIANVGAPRDIVDAIGDANRTLYGDRAKDVRWSLIVRPMYLNAFERRGSVSEPIDDILTEELGKRGVGVRRAVRRLETDTFEAVVEVNADLAKATMVFSDAVARLGHLTERQNGGREPTVAGVVGGGFFNANPAVVRVRLTPLSDGRCTASVTAYAKEGLIRQRTAEKAVRRVLGARELVGMYDPRA